MSIACGTPIRVNILSQPSHLAVVRAAAEKLCGLVGFDAEATMRIVLSLDEGLTNIIRHAYDNATDRPIEIEMTVLGRSEPIGLRLCLRDWGKAVDPSKIRSRDLEDVRPGGLGVHIMQQCMDEVRYEHCEEGGTMLTLTKNLASGKKDPSE